MVKAKRCTSHNRCTAPYSDLQWPRLGSEGTKMTVAPRNVRAGPASVALMRRARRNLYLFILYRRPIMRPFEVLAGSLPIRCGSGGLLRSPSHSPSSPENLRSTVSSEILLCNPIRGRRSCPGQDCPKIAWTLHLSPKRALIWFQISTRMPRSLAFGVGLNLFWVSINARSPTNVIYLGLPSRG